MVMVGIDDSSISADSHSSQLAWSECWQPIGHSCQDNTGGVAKVLAKKQCSLGPSSNVTLHFTFLECFKS